MLRVKDEYFKRADSIYAKWDMSKVLDEMDANGVQRVIVTGNMNEPGGSPVKFVEARPDRFALSAGGFDFLRPMPSIRRLQSFVASYPVAYAAAGPGVLGRRDVPAGQRRVLPALHQVLRA